MPIMEAMLDRPVSEILPIVEAELFTPRHPWPLKSVGVPADMWVMACAKDMLKLLRGMQKAKVRDALAKVQERLMSGLMAYNGVVALKNPFDLWTYREIMYELRPNAVVELGVSRGGATLWLADTCQSIGKGFVVGVDKSFAMLHETVPRHPRIKLVQGDVIARFGDVKKLCSGAETVLVIEDTAHTYEHTLSVMRTYGDVVTCGSYLIVEDTICHHGLNVGHSPGPYEAVAAFLAENKKFASDRDRERFCVTWNPTGFLKRENENARTELQ
ncbi:MAG: CmcI family methyltransferase [bacterium]